MFVKSGGMRKFDFCLIRDTKVAVQEEEASHEDLDVSKESVPEESNVLEANENESSDMEPIVKIEPKVVHRQKERVVSSAEFEAAAVSRFRYEVILIPIN